MTNDEEKQIFVEKGRQNSSKNFDVNLIPISQFNSEETDDNEQNQTKIITRKGRKVKKKTQRYGFL